ncbi:MAG: type IV toxin-antitoxin system AbiEi family antitoxin domain-containing protein, partial [Alphaproteobacteria bacterium]|nr:type IV toxin-antitoxin system AbiEi family antitoxin domain-containing protein [Alphaproteobacteria bacterium]
MVRRREFLCSGVAPETLARLVRKGRVCRVARGLYQKATIQPVAERTLAEVSKLVPRGVICLVSALQFHGLTSEVPAQTWIAIPSSDWKPTVAYPPVNALFFGPKSYSAGIETHRIERVPVRIYGVAKTIVDCFR